MRSAAVLASLLATPVLGEVYTATATHGASVYCQDDAVPVCSDEGGSLYGACADGKDGKTSPDFDNMVVLWSSTSSAWSKPASCTGFTRACGMWYAKMNSCINAAKRQGIAKFSGIIWHVSTRYPKSTYCYGIPAAGSNKPYLTGIQPVSFSTAN